MSPRFRIRVYNNLGDIIDFAIRHPEFAELRTHINYRAIQWHITTKRKCRPLFTIFAGAEFLIYIHWLGVGGIMGYLLQSTMGWRGWSATIEDGGFLALDTTWAQIQWTDPPTVMNLFLGVVTANGLQLGISIAWLSDNNHVTERGRRLNGVVFINS